MPVGSIFRCLMALPIWSISSRRLLELVVDSLAEADDRVVERPPAFFLSASALTFSSLETRSNFSRIVLLVVLHADRLVEEPDDGELVLLRWRRISRASWSSATPMSWTSKIGSPAILPPPPRSTGNALTVSCVGGVCTSYYGPDIGAAISSAFSEWISTRWYESDAKLYTTDHKLLWRSEDQKGGMGRAG